MIFRSNSGSLYIARMDALGNPIMRRDEMVGLAFSETAGEPGRYHCYDFTWNPKVCHSIPSLVFPIPLASYCKMGRLCFNTVSGRLCILAELPTFMNGQQTFVYNLKHPNSGAQLPGELIPANVQHLEFAPRSLKFELKNPLYVS